ncbi:quinoprotein glucose dehydrogenase [Granulicella aggregans]|uniref:Quinoprotein glucose dehydrogenase n=1 Tax=Granulicella aggregans TaxID=474949 RepID=A0A7W7ZCI9_9BACT|nr:c-type cytochrome [Granulicella aggregans]MBB5057267.1 quinoprotein glucose dehydrogenase [Granulicella aggregans]
MNVARRIRFSATILAAAAVLTCHTTHAQQVDWRTYNGGVDGDHYSPLQQITTANVPKLRQMWRFDAGTEGGLQTNPLVVGHRLFGYTSNLQVIALDATTGERLWHFDAGVSGGQPSRGLTYWTDGHESRLFAYVMNFLFALDPATGKPILSFGEGGRLDMRKDLDSDYTQNNVALTTPGTLYKNLLIVGFRAPETNPGPRGDIRAYNVLTGKLVWSFHTIPHPGEDGYQTWPPGAWTTAGAANNWAGMSVDMRRGIVFVPTGSAVSDFYGFDRLGDDLFANSLIALDANTGKRLWFFQGVHHDIWDRDFPATPALVTVRHDGKLIDAVAQTSKQGFVFVLDRVTGKPIFPIEERAFPPSTVPGEVASPTQPIPSAPAPFARQLLTEDLLTNRTQEAHAWALKEFKTFRSEGQFVPLSVDKQTVVFPGFDGGAEWGGPAVDPRTGVLYVNANDIAWTGGLTENKPGGSPGQVLYQTQCAICHGGDRKGNPPAFPALVDIDHRLTTPQTVGVIQGGKGRMPGFPSLQGGRLEQLMDYLVHPTDSESAAVFDVGGKDPIGQVLYAKHCALCHGDDRSGEVSNYPGLLGVRARLTDSQILANIHDGKGRMPALPELTSADNAAILRFLGPSLESSPQSDKTELASSPNGTSQVPRYRFTGYRKFLDPDGYPAVAPPWGTLNAIDLNTVNFYGRSRSAATRSWPPKG